MAYFTNTTTTMKSKEASTGRYPEIMNSLRPLPLKVALSNKHWQEKSDHYTGSPVSISFRKSESEGTPRQLEDFHGNALLDIIQPDNLLSPSFDEGHAPVNGSALKPSALKSDLIKMGFSPALKPRYISPLDRRVEPQPFQVLKNTFRTRYEAESRNNLKLICEV